MVGLKAILTQFLGKLHNARIYSSGTVTVNFIFASMCKFYSLTSFYPSVADSDLLRSVTFVRSRSVIIFYGYASGSFYLF